MNLNLRKAVLLVAGLTVFGGVLPVHADLPTLDDKEWLGYFVGVKNRDFRFDIDTKGGMTLLPLSVKKEDLDHRLRVKIDFQVEEIQPNGQVVVKNVMQDSLMSEQAPTHKPQDIVIKGKVTGDATFEAYLAEDRGVIVLGGKITSPGTLKNPLRFSIFTRIPNAYPSSKLTEDLGKFEALTKRDRVQVMFADGKNGKISGSDPVSALSKDGALPPISAVNIDFSSLDGHKYVITAEPNSAMVVSGEADKLSYQGIGLHWSSDAAKDPEGKARLRIAVK